MSTSFSLFSTSRKLTPLLDHRYKESSFKSTSGKTIPLRFYATPDQVEQTQLALATTAKLLPIYERVFDIPYPLAKVSSERRRVGKFWAAPKRKCR